MFVTHDIILSQFTGKTQVWHNLEQDHYISGYESPGSYVKGIAYSASLQQVIALVNVSINCTQYIRINCFNAKSKYGSNGWHHWWENRHGSKMYNWGSPKGTEGCSCSIGTQNGKIRHTLVPASLDVQHFLLTKGEGTSKAKSAFYLLE